MRMNAIAAALVASLLWQSTALAQYGYGMYGGAQPCPYNFGAANGAQNGNDEISELFQTRLEKKQDLKDTNRKIDAAEKKQGRMRDAINDSIDSSMASTIIEHMDYGYGCCPATGIPPQGMQPGYNGDGGFQPNPYGGAPPQGYNGGPPPGYNGGQPPGQPTYRPPLAGADTPADVGGLTPAPSDGSRKPAVASAKAHKPAASAKAKPAAPAAKAPESEPAPAPASRPPPEVPAGVSPVGSTTPVWQGSLAELDAAVMQGTADRSKNSDGNRAPASVAAAVDAGEPQPARGLADDSHSIQRQQPDTTGQPPAAQPTAQQPYAPYAPPTVQYGPPGDGMQFMAPPLQAYPWQPPAQKRCQTGGDAFRTPDFLQVCRADGYIDARACALFRSGGGERGSGGRTRGSVDCVTAIAQYRKLQKDLEKLRRDASRLEEEIDDLTDQIGDARRSAREDARLEADCPECTKRGSGGRSGGGGGGPTTAQTIVGGIAALAGLGFGYAANQQMNKQNQALGYPGQSFLPYAGYWTGQGIMQSAFGYPFGGAGMYGGVGAGMNGGFGCAGGIGGGGFPMGPMGMMGPYGPGGGLYGNMGGPFGSPYGAGGYPQQGGGMYMPGMSPWGVAGPGGYNPYGGGGFGNPYSNGYGGLATPIGQIGGNPYGGMTPYGNQLGGFNPMAYGAYPSIPGMSSGASPYMSYNPYNPLGSMGSSINNGMGLATPIGAFSSPGMMSAGLANGAIYNNLGLQMQQLNTNLLQMNSGYGTIPGYNNSSGYSVYPSLYGGGGAYLGVGAGGAFGVSPLGNYNYYGTYGSGTGTTGYSDRTR